MRTLLLFFLIAACACAQVIPPNPTPDTVATLVVTTVTVLTEIDVVFSADGHPYVQGVFETRNLAADGSVLGVVKTQRVSTALSDIPAKYLAGAQSAVNALNTLLTSGLASLSSKKQTTK